MAKENNLKDFLTDVADAIREKEGSTGLINPQEFSAKIRAIETGGGGESGGGGGGASAGAVNFRDYDGTILHSFSKEEFLALEALPELPTQTGLICQGWNWTLEEAQVYVSENGNLEVGSLYITDDGKTRLYISIAEKGRMKITLKLTQTISGGITIDWGDGSSNATSGTNVTATHTYARVGDYIISLDVADGCVMGFGGGSSSYSVMGAANNTGQVYCNMLKKVELGKGITTLSPYAFTCCMSMQTISIPDTIATIDYYAFNKCYSLRCINIPYVTKTIGNYAFYYCYNLMALSFGANVKSVGTYICQNCYSLEVVTFPPQNTLIKDYSLDSCRSLKSVVVPKGVTSLGSNCLSQCPALKYVYLPDSVVTLNPYVFYGDMSLREVRMPKNLTYIGNYVFSNCSSLKSCILPKGMTTIGQSMFGSCYSLSTFSIPDDFVTIKNTWFSNCNSLATIVIPSGVTSIEANAFNNCYGMACYDFRKVSVVPTLANSNAFSNIPSDTKIVVPDDLYDSWISASNWSTYASKIIKASEYTD